MLDHLVAVRILAALVTQEVSWSPSVLSLTSALAGFPFTASHMHAAQIVLPSRSRSR